MNGTPQNDFDAAASPRRRVAQRCAQEVLDETIACTFARRMQPVPVMLRRLKPAGGRRMLMLVRWT